MVEFLHGSEKFKRFICSVLLIGFLLAQIPILINAYMFEFSNRCFLTIEEAAEQNFDCVLILGAGVRKDKPTPMLKERLSKGVEIYDTGCTDRILVSGDHGRTNYDEVNVMKDFLIENGVIPDEIFMDHAGFSTYETMYRARDVFKVKKVVIVTQKYHLYRAVYNARKLGLEAYGVPADGMYNYALSVRLYNNTREALARTKDFFWCIISPEPTYLGEVIPINSSGSLTNDKV